MRGNGSQPVRMAAPAPPDRRFPTPCRHEIITSNDIRVTVGPRSRIHQFKSGEAHQ